MAVKRTRRGEALARLEAAPGGWRVVGEMNIAAVPVLLSQAQNLLDFEGDLEIDLGDVAHADSAGLALLLEWVDLSLSRGGDIRFRRIPEGLMNIARVSNVAELLRGG